MTGASGIRVSGRELARIDAADRAAFTEHLVRDEPCVIVGGAADWPATMRWSIASLSERIGDLAIRCKVSSTSTHPNFRAASHKEMFATEATTVRSLFASFEGSEPARRLFTGDEQFVLRVRDDSTTIHEPFRTLLDDAPVPDLVPRDRLYTVWAWFSGRGVHTGLHYDNNGCHNLNAQLAGQKRCVLYPPAALAAMELFPIGGTNPAVNCSRLDLASDVLRRGRDSMVPSGGYEATLETGDLLFIPAWWFHAFWHLGDFNANMNYWWRPHAVATNPVSERQAGDRR